MAEYAITFARSARKELEALPDKIGRRVLAKIAALTDNPRPPGMKKLQGEDGLWRIRFGDYRVIYEISDSARIVDVTVIRHRSEVYRDF